MIPTDLPQVVTAIGGLGTAAFGLLEAVKPVVPTINHIGFARIRATVTSLAPDEPGAKQPINSLPKTNIIQTLLSNWANGADLASQKSIAKSLIKLHLSAANAPDLAKATNVDAALLTQVAANSVSGAALTPPLIDVNARFDLILTAMLDEAYQHADQVYRNWTRGLAALFAVLLALAGAWSLTGGTIQSFWMSKDMFTSLLVGLLATPLAPIAKDVSTALSTAVNTMQLVKK